MTDEASAVEFAGRRIACAGLGHSFRIWEPGRVCVPLVEATAWRAFRLDSERAAEDPLGARE
jgi:hypothetical protein